jgi:phenylpyruvate tautomerase PptA (4-oxalocrotonate tautomerase family)
MPAAQINVLSGHPRASLQAAVKGVAAAMVDVLGAPADRLEVWVNEIPADLWAFDGGLADEKFAEHDRFAVETPFVQCTLLAGRPVELMQRFMAAVTDAVADAIRADRERVRVQIELADPDLWSIGGVPASIKRAGELAARARQSSGQ